MLWLLVEFGLEEHSKRIAGILAVVLLLGMAYVPPVRDEAMRWIDKWSKDQITPICEHTRDLPVGGTADVDC